MYASPSKLRDWATAHKARNGGDFGQGSPANIRRIKAEQSIVRKTLKRVLAAGYSVRVYDGEELHPRTSSFTRAWGALGETDCDWLRVYSSDGQTYVGGIYFVWGNGEDIVSDWSWHGDANELHMAFLATGEAGDPDA